MTVTETLLELEERMWRTNRNGDGAFFAELLREDALVVSKYGVMTKAQGIPVIQANQNPYVKTDLSEQKVIQLDETTRSSPIASTSRPLSRARKSSCLPTPPASTPARVPSGVASSISRPLSETR